VHSLTSVSVGIAKTTCIPAQRPADCVGKGPIVSFMRSGLAVPWDSRYESLLEFAEACDIPVPWSCRMGICRECESRLIDGTIGYGPGPLDRPADGKVLLCCSTPLTAVQLDL
jgi:ferredoxin